MHLGSTQNWKLSLVSERHIGGGQSIITAIFNQLSHLFAYIIFHLFFSCIFFFGPFTSSTQTATPPSIIIRSSLSMVLKNPSLILFSIYSAFSLMVSAGSSLSFPLFSPALALFWSLPHLSIWFAPFSSPHPPPSLFLSRSKAIYCGLHPSGV